MENLAPMRRAMNDGVQRTNPAYFPSQYLSIKRQHLEDIFNFRNLNIPAELSVYCNCDVGNLSQVAQNPTKMCRDDNDLPAQILSLEMRKQLRSLPGLSTFCKQVHLNMPNYENIFQKDNYETYTQVTPKNEEDSNMMFVTLQDYLDRKTHSTQFAPISTEEVKLERTKSDDKNTCNSSPGVEANPCFDKPFYNVTEASTILDGVPTNRFSRRYDVIKKTIFRKVKKYFTTEFKQYYDYTRRHRRKGVDYNQLMFSKANEYIKNRFGPTTPESVALVLVAMIDVKEKYTHPEPSFSDNRRKLLKLIKSFNLFLMDEMMQEEGYRFLVKTCLNNPNFVGEIISSKEDPEVARRYRNQIYQCLMLN